MESPGHSEKLAELIGVLLGDGSSYYSSKNNAWQVRIAFHSEETQYREYIRTLCKELFDIEPKLKVHNKYKEAFLCLDRKCIGEFLAMAGFPPGNKMKRETNIPDWIKENPAYLAACIRGLIDTDGSIYRLSQRDSDLLRISFTSHSETLMQDVRTAFLLCGYNPTKVVLKHCFTISRQKEVGRHINEIGFSNTKHRLRLERFTAPSSSGQSD